MLRNQGMRVRYQYEMPGHNWRLTDLQAAVAVPQLGRLAATTAARAANAARLTEGLAGIPGLRTPIVPEGREHVWHQYTLLIDGAVGRDDVAKHLEAAGIGHGLYYPRLMHDYDCYRGHPQIVVDATPHAQRVTTQALSIPVHQHLTPGDVDRVIAAVRGAFGA